MSKEDDLSFQRQRRLSQIAAVITVLSEDRGLYEMASPFINVVETSINWDGIFSLPLSFSQRVVCQWAFGLGEDRILEGFNPFEFAEDAEPAMRRAIINGLKARWRV